MVIGTVHFTDSEGGAQRAVLSLPGGWASTLGEEYDAYLNVCFLPREYSPADGAWGAAEFHRFSDLVGGFAVREQNPGPEDPTVKY
jgi:hypothetical protein